MQQNHKDGHSSCDEEETSMPITLRHAVGTVEWAQAIYDSNFASATQQLKNHLETWLEVLYRLDEARKEDESWLRAQRDSNCLGNDMVRFMHAFGDKKGFETWLETSAGKPEDKGWSIRFDLKLESVDVDDVVV
jgi:hypothetical protein